VRHAQARKVVPKNIALRRLKNRRLRRKHHCFEYAGLLLPLPSSLL
jgi:hypothetical protein